MSTNEDGSMGDEVEERVYDLMCEKQGCMVRVGLPSDVALKDIQYETDVVFVNPTVGAVANATFNGADVDWYVKADDIIPAGAAASGRPSTRPEQTTGQKHSERALEKAGQ